MNVSASAKRRAKRQKKSKKEALFQTACEHGDLAMVELLLAEGVDPSNRDDRAINAANRDGHMEIVNRLVQDERVDSTKILNALLKEACIDGRTDEVDTLLKNKRVNPAANYNIALACACQYGFLDIVDRLLQDDRVNPADFTNTAIQNACYNGHLHIVERLLQDVRVNPGDNDNDALRLACLNNRADVVARLLQNARVDPSANSNIFAAACSTPSPWAPAESCAKRTSENVVERLLLDPRISTIGETIWFAIENAYSYNNRSMLNMLLPVAMWHDPPSKFHFHNNATRMTGGGGPMYYVCEDTGCIRTCHEFCRHEYKNARIKWYAERAERFRELHVELVASVVSHNRYP